jgi:ADP-heptose:LPS heptosyltransferase
MRIRPREAVLYLLLRLVKSLDRRRNSLPDLEPSKIRSILVVSSTAIGDTLMSTPAIRAVRECFPRARIVAHFNVHNMELFENNPHIDGIVPYYGGYKCFWRTIRRLRRERFDLALIFHGNEPQATPMAYLSGARFIVKLPNTSAYRFLLSNRERVLTWEDFAHGVEQRLQVAQLAGCRIGDKRMVLPPAPDQEGAVERFLQVHGVGPADPVLGFQVAASTVSRMWFAEKFVELGRRLAAEHPAARIVITGSPQEAAYAREIAAAIGNKTVVAAGELRLKQLPWLIRRLRLLVTGDTGIMHLAIAVGTPVVALFAAADARRSGPYYDVDKHTVIQKHRTCVPCVGKRCTFQICMDNISVDEVLSAVTHTLQRSPGAQAIPAAVARND